MRPFDHASATSGPRLLFCGQSTRPHGLRESGHGLPWNIMNKGHIWLAGEAPPPSRPPILRYRIPPHAKAYMMRLQTLLQENFEAHVAINGPTQTRIRVYATRQSDLPVGLEDLRQFSPIGLSQSWVQGGLFLSFDHVARGPKRVRNDQE